MQDAGWPKYSQVAVSRTEEGARAVRLDEAISLAKLFGRNVQDLLDPKEVIDSWQNLRILMEDYSDRISRLRVAVEDVEEYRVFVAVHAQMLKEEVDAVGGPKKVSKTMAKVLSNAELMLSRSTVDIVDGTVYAWRHDRDGGEAHGEHSEEA